MELKTEIQWRGSKYQLESVEDGEVKWHNPVSRYHGSCSIDDWKMNQPYGDKQLGGQY